MARKQARFVTITVWVVVVALVLTMLAAIVPLVT